jgi:hypothetical protein
VLIRAPHPWAGNTGEVIAIGSPLTCLPLMLKVRMDSGDECFVKPSELDVITKRASAY